MPAPKRLGSHECLPDERMRIRMRKKVQMKNPISSRKMANKRRQTTTKIFFLNWKSPQIRSFFSPFSKYARRKVIPEKMHIRIPERNGIRPEPGSLAVPRSNLGA